MVAYLCYDICKYRDISLKTDSFVLNKKKSVLDVIHGSQGKIILIIIIAYLFFTFQKFGDLP